MSDQPKKKLSGHKRMFNQGIEASAAKSKSWLEEWGSDLAHTRDEYLAASKSGICNGRKISPEMANQFAKEFNERAEAVYACGALLEAELLKMKRT